ncbi:rhomboid family intramembrane serine protease [Nesterenkonia aurantiaca]|uniref:Membrane associated rhomboid family serine protease n=1 Tax=Nesterenkonia aurantiaca TaxID=1436010 RepID=A0A4V6Q165_9MICC|nr:rhomboid family intramembrane serine protease [Nesterenkonia aurantiaca]TDS86454.1 membrane associated rhomboid family serine protease [Nesterenkonia aurantiaca]
MSRAFQRSGAGDQIGSKSEDSWGSLSSDLRSTFGRTFLPVVVPMIGMWAVYLVMVFTGNWLNRAFGLQARDVDGLLGILFMPLLHGSLGHILSNSMSWLVLGGMVSLLTRRFVSITAVIWLLSGVLLWLGGTPWICHAPEGFDCGRLHIGASAVIYGFATFLVAFGFITRRILAVVFSLAVLFLYGLSMLVGMTPISPGGVSWSGHLAGAAAGVVVAFIFTRSARAERASRRIARG